MIIEPNIITDISSSYFDYMLGKEYFKDNHFADISLKILNDYLDICRIIKISKINLNTYRNIVYTELQISSPQKLMIYIKKFIIKIIPNTSSSHLALIELRLLRSEEIFFLIIQIEMNNLWSIEVFFIIIWANTMDDTTKLTNIVYIYIYEKNDHIINNHNFHFFRYSKYFTDETKYIGLFRFVSVGIMMSQREKDYHSFFLFVLDSRDRYQRSNFILWFVYELSNLLKIYFQNDDI